MISRRSLLAGVAGLPSPSLPVPAGNRLAFNIIRNDGVIGQHTLTFTPPENALTVNIAVDIRVGLGPIALFRYSHRASEQWRNGLIFAVDARTDDDGSDLQMTVRRRGDGLIVTGSAVSSYTAPPHAMPATHWNHAMLDGPLINTQNGQLMKPAVATLGLEQVSIGSGMVSARHYQLRGEADLDTWYDLTPSWVALRFTAKDGSLIRYERVA